MSRYHLLLLVPFVGTLWVPFYDSADPRIGGVPYFYWYQFLWVVIGAAITAAVYLLTRPTRPAQVAQLGRRASAPRGEDADIHDGAPPHDTPGADAADRRKPSKGQDR